MIRVAVIVLSAAVWASPAYSQSSGFLVDVPEQASPSRPAIQDRAGLLGPNEKWIVLASRESLTDAAELARRFSSVRTDVRIFKSVNNWYTVVFGPVTSDAASGIKDDLLRQGTIPADAYLAGGNRFVEDVTRTAQSPTVASDRNQDTTRPAPSSQTAPQASRSENNNEVAQVQAPAVAEKPSAASGPSYAETVEFIQNRASELGDEVYHQINHGLGPGTLTLKLKMKVSGLKITIESERQVILEVRYNKKTTVFEDNYVSTADLAALGIEIDKVQNTLKGTNYDYCGLKLMCSNTACFSQTENTNYYWLPRGPPEPFGDTSATSERSIVVPTNSSSSCSRLQSALSHLIKLAGGSLAGGSPKKDPF